MTKYYGDRICQKCGKEIPYGIEKCRCEKEMKTIRGILEELIKGKYNYTDSRVVKRKLNQAEKEILQNYIPKDRLSVERIEKILKAMCNWNEFFTGNVPKKIATKLFKELTR